MYGACGSVRIMPDYSLFGDDHVRKYEETGGKTGHDWNGTSCLVLRMRGRRQEAGLADHGRAVAGLRHLPGRVPARHSGGAAAATRR